MKQLDAANREHETQSVHANTDHEPTQPTLHGELVLTQHSTLYEKVSVFLHMSLPTVLAFFFGYGSQIIIMMFAGQYSTASGNTSVVLAGVSLASVFTNVSLLSILIGLGSAMETLGSQYNGAKNYSEVGKVLNRSFLILGSLLLPGVLLWSHAREIFLYIGIAPEVCEVIQRFVMVRAFAIPMDVIYTSYENYLLAIGVVNPPMYSNVLMNVCLLSFNYVFVFVWHWDYTCLAWSFVISMFIQTCFLIVLSLHYEEVQRSLQPLNWRDLCDWHGIYEFLSLGLPGTIMICSEW